MTEQEKREKQLKNYAIMLIVGYLILAYVSLHFGEVYSSYEDEAARPSLSQIISEATVHMETTPIFIPSREALEILMMPTLLYFPFAVNFLLTRRKYMIGKEHGTAKWAGKLERKRLLDNNFRRNILFTQTEGMSLNTRKTGKNLNMMIIGSPGTGKTRYFVKPNILQANTSYVVTDPKGEILRDTACFLQKEGYKVKVLNLIEMEYSDCYNPFHYIRKESDVLKVINCLIKNTTPENANVSDPFWEKAETALLQALCFFIWHELPENEQNFSTVLELLRKAEVREDEEGYESDLDRIFKRLAHLKPDHIALKQYAIFKQSAGKTAKSILISTSVRLACFNIQALANIVEKDTIDFYSFGDEKTVLYVIIPDSDTTFNFIVAMMYTQMIDTLYYVADFRNRGRLKHHVRFILDEFANIGQIPDFDKVIGTMRSREVSANIIIQNLAQLKNLYGESWETIAGNCDSLLFLGGKDSFTLQYVSEALGKETIDTRDMQYAKEPKMQRTTTLSYGILARELMLPDEIGRMPDRDCLLLIRGLNPFYSKKFKLESHRNYKYLYDSSDKYFFDYRNVGKANDYKKRVENLGGTKKQQQDDLLFEKYFDSRNQELGIDTVESLLEKIRKKLGV